MPKTRPAARHGSLRVIAGHLRGSRIEVPDGPGLRPTPDRVRETLFNWLAPWLDGARCLDLYAGTGLLGIEALSRGAAACVFVERDRALAGRIGANLARLRVENARVLDRAALDFLATPPATPFDVVFIDPPFEAAAWDATLAALEDGGWLAASALIHVEAPTTAAFAAPTCWQVHRESRAGAVRHVLYRRAAGDRLS